MNSVEKGITLSSRSIKESDENNFVLDFLESNNLFKNEKLEYCILKETLTDSGVADVIVVSWVKERTPNLNSSRRSLTKNDLKILHYISTKKSRGISYKTIEKKLGYSEKPILNTINKLEKADLIVCSGNIIKVKDLKSNFFLKEIISIEAKLKNWKKVIEQATLNTIFSSQSYILIPEQKARNTRYFDHLDNPGLITFDGKQAIVKIKAKSNPLPASYHSWLINEHIATNLNNGRK